METKHNYRFFFAPHVKSENTGIRVVTTYTIDGGTVALGAAFCSPSDEFDWAVGKELATQRLTDDPFVIDLTVLPPTETLLSIIAELLSTADILGIDGAPHLRKYGKFVPK